MRRRIWQKSCFLESSLVQRVWSLDSHTERTREVFDREVPRYSRPDDFLLTHPIEPWSYVWHQVSCSVVILFVGLGRVLRLGVVFLGTLLTEAKSKRQRPERMEGCRQFRAKFAAQIKRGGSKLPLHLTPGAHFPLRI